ncbi:MAG TPA: Uma2 family endonuclease [Pyrinomonadaceae bacterium]|nr:Uma2 family endonuclease [Pyrinomonadaceae bacterium]
MSHNLTPSDYYIPPELIALTHRVVTPEQFERLCAEYTDLRLELTSTGDLIIMPPKFSETGMRNADLTYQLMAWTKKDGSGVCFDSSTGFTLANGAIRSPDGSWVKRKRWDSLTKEEKQSFAPICPDFVVELRSESDRLTELRNKMLEWIENGVSLGWLIDPYERKVYVYRPNEEVIILDNPETISGDPLLPGFTLNLTGK